MTPKEARRYVRSVMYAMLDCELNFDTHLNPREGWMFGGFEMPDDADKIVAVEREIRRVMKGLDR